MIARTLARRLERLEAELAPPDDEPTLTILLTSPGEPDQIFKVHWDNTAARRRELWSPRRGFKDGK